MAKSRKNAFNSAMAPPLEQARGFLDYLSVAFDVRDGKLVVPGNLHIVSKLPGNTLPDLSRVVVMGNFSCRDLHLTSLKGCPQFVGGSFDCAMNPLKNLLHGPKHVGGDYQAGSCELTSLRGAPKKIGGNFGVKLNRRLKALEYAPQISSGIYTDKGCFSGLQDIPDDLRLSRQRRDFIAQRQAKREDVLQKSPTLQDDVKVDRPHLKHRG